MINWTQFQAEMTAAGVLGTDVLYAVKVTSEGGPARISRYKSTDPANPNLVLLTIVND